MFTHRRFGDFTAEELNVLREALEMYPASESRLDARDRDRMLDELRTEEMRRPYRYENGLPIDN